MRSSSLRSTGRQTLPGAPGRGRHRGMLRMRQRKFATTSGIPQGPACISKPSARRHSSLCCKLVTSTNTTPAVSGVGVAATRPFLHSAYDQGPGRRRKPQNLTHSMSVSGVGEVVSEGGLVPLSHALPRSASSVLAPTDLPAQKHQASSVCRHLERAVQAVHHVHRRGQCGRMSEQDPVVAAGLPTTC